MTKEELKSWCEENGIELHIRIWNDHVGVLGVFSNPPHYYRRENTMPDTTTLWTEIKKELEVTINYRLDYIHDNENT